MVDNEPDALVEENFEESVGKAAAATQVLEQGPVTPVMNSPSAPAEGDTEVEPENPVWPPAQPLSGGPVRAAPEASAAPAPSVGNNTPATGTTSQRLSQIHFAAWA